MPLPRGDEYQDAVQNPRICFLDTELQSCQVEITSLGIPKPYAGSFTTTYHLYNHSRHWAVRCFTRSVTDLQQRYRAIGRFIVSRPDRHFVEANCLLQGIKINGIWIPIIKMKWVDGLPLNLYIESILASPPKIRSTADKFSTMIQCLENHGIAHGDLQHGNILVNQDELFLIDYDGMFLPELAHLPSNEIGHPNYQHPLRSEKHSGKNLDRFSAIVIYLGLLALSLKPQLWERFDQGENILFKKEDFLNPGNSILLNELLKLRLPSRLVEKFAGICLLDFTKIPSLDEFLTGNFNYPKVNFSPSYSNKHRGLAAQRGTPSYNYAATSNQSPGGTERISMTDMKILERLYGRQGQATTSIKTTRNRSTNLSHPPSSFTQKSPGSHPIRSFSSLKGRIQGSPWLHRGKRFLEITGVIIQWIIRFLTDLFFYNRPRVFTRQALERIGLFLFYVAGTVAILIGLVVVIGWFLTQFLP